MIAIQCVYAYDFVIIDGIAYNLNEAELTAEVTSSIYDKYSGNITIPEEINYSGKNYRVKRIRETAFSNNVELTSITIPNSITSIGRSAFYNCSGLTSVTIPNSVTSIEESAFSNCTGLTSITISNSITSIGISAFANCTGLTFITIPNGVISIGDNAFGSCTGLTSVTIPNSVTSIGTYAFSNCTGLTSLTIPSSVTNIGYYAFFRCIGLTSITIPNSVTSIGNSAFACNGLISITAPAAFFNSEEADWSYFTKIAQTITITSGELTDDHFAVINRNCKTLKTLDIENTDNTELSDEAIKGCYNLETIKLPKNLTKIGYMAMAECMALKEVNIPSSVTEIGDRAFENCRSMKTITFGNGSAMKTAEESQLQRIGNWSFYNCHELQNLDIPEGVTEIGLAAFYGCTYLQNLTLPSTLRTIGDNTFAKCEKLAGVRCAAEVPPTIDAKTFEDVDRTIPVIVPQGSLKAYKEDMYWSEFVNLQEETTDAKEIPAEFENVSVTDGTVTYSGEKPFCIHNLNGQDVTNLNGSLNGIHVVTIGTASQNMLIK